MNLSEFPIEISRHQRKLLAQDQLVRRMQSDVDQLIAQIDYETAFDTELKNDAQRKAKRLERMTADPYLGSAEELQAAIDRRIDLRIGLQLLQNQFDVAKLELTEIVAQHRVFSGNGAGVLL